VPVDCGYRDQHGSVVGGSFAAGTTPADMEQIITQTDWSEVFTDRPPRSEISPRLKQDDYKGLFAPEFGVHGSSIVVQKGIVSGVNIEASCAPSPSNQAASRFPQAAGCLSVRWRPTSRPANRSSSITALSRGRCARAWPSPRRAPVEIDGRLLVDGGIANNLRSTSRARSAAR